MTTPQFSELPTVPCEAWFPRALIRGQKDVEQARQTLISNRNAALTALAEAQSQDLASFQPAKVQALPLLQEELAWRRSFSDLIRTVLTAATAYHDQCIAEIQTAEDAVKERLLSAGYEAPVGGVVSRGCYGPDWIARHGHVLAAKAKDGEMSSFRDAQTAARQENERQMQALTARLTQLRDTVLS